VIGQVTPWNYPMMMAVWKYAPAIAAGNTTVLKPSDTTPVTTARMAEIITDAGILPPGVLNVVTGDRNTGKALVEHKIPQMVAITGSVRAGMQVAQSAALDVKRVHL
jgi:betaine-aldehyde dehydrogenase